MLLQRHPFQTATSRSSAAARHRSTPVPACAYRAGHGGGRLPSSGKKYGLPDEQPGRRRRMGSISPIAGAVGRRLAGKTGLEGQPASLQELEARRLLKAEPSSTATRTAGATRRRSSSAPPTQWFIGMDRKDRRPTLRWIAERAVERPSSSRPGARRPSAKAMMKTARTGASRASATGACRSRSSCTKETGELHPRTLELIEAVACAWRRRHRSLVQLDAKELLGDRGRPLRQDEPTRSTSGSTPAPPTGTCCAVRTRDVSHIRPISISKAPTSIAAGSSRRC